MWTWYVIAYVMVQTAGLYLHQWSQISAVPLSLRVVALFIVTGVALSLARS